MFQPSYWDKSEILDDIDVCIIGSGIVGLSAACHLAKSNRKLRILVLERGPLPYGASTRNAGFACFGSPSEIIDDLTHESKDEVLVRIDERYCGIQKLRSLFTDKQLDYHEYGGYEIFKSSDQDVFQECTDQLDNLNNELRTIFKKNIFEHVTNDLNEIGIRNMNSAIHINVEGQLNAGKMMRSFINLAVSLNVRIMNGIEVDKVIPQSDRTAITTKNGFEINSKSCIISVNGFAKQFLPDLDVAPARAQVLVTEPIANLKLKGTYHYNKGFTYFRNIGNRILIGGGRDLDIKGETTTELDTTAKIQDHLESFLNTHLIPGNLKVDIDHRWSGIMGVGNSKSPVIREVSQGMFCAVRLGGMGVAIGCTVGEKVANLVLQRF
jgi:glycine/D-amino acid oxidase-like deaminating enzyme